jgi:tRNA threonylcarbamoyladenosine biosynthesis protein TsaB
MALLLHIDTALETARVIISENEIPLAEATNDNQKDHAAWLHEAVKKLFAETAKTLNGLNAISVNIGPGSYTGLRVGLSAAKGFCYALDIPLIALNALELIASVATGAEKDTWICPMIDARRMEVFTALYDNEGNEVVVPHALVLDEHSFEDILTGRKILFLGNGSMKFQAVCHNANAIFKNLPLNAHAQSHMAYKCFIGNNFVRLAYVEPMYIKEFHTKKGNSSV